MDRGAWQAIVHGVAKNGTQLKRLSMQAHTHTLYLRRCAAAAAVSRGERGKDSSRGAGDGDHDKTGTDDGYSDPEVSSCPLSNASFVPDLLLTGFPNCLG